MHVIVALYRFVFWGGLQKDTLWLAEELHSRGHEVTVFTTDWKKPPEYLKMEYVKAGGLTNVSRMKSFSEAWQKRLARGGFDVSVAMERVPGADFYFAADSCMKAYYEKKYPNWLLKIHPRYRYILETERKVCGRDSKTLVWCISPFQKEDYSREYGTPESRLFDLPPGMNPKCIRPSSEERVAEIRNAVRSELGISDDDIVMVIVGSNITRKGIDRLFMAAAALPEPLKAKARLLLVGNLNSKEIGNIAINCSLSGKYILTGPRQDVERLLLASDIMVHPAREEGAGTVLVEGIASGIPVICTACCGFSRIVGEAAGLVVPEPFEQTRLDGMLADTLSNLPAVTAKTRAYAASHDFTSRHRVMADFIEKHHII